ncbi:MAG: TolC family protein, partial [Syntrophomonas sp.]
MRLYIKKRIICCLISCFIVICVFPALSAAQSTGTTTVSTTSGLILTLDDAKERAVEHSNTLKKADNSIEQGELNRDTAQDNVKYAPADGSDSEASSAFIKLIQSDISWQITKKDKEVSLDSLEKEVFQKYTNVLTAQEKVKAAEKALKYADFQRLAARVGYQVKNQSLISKNTAERNYITKELALAKNKNDLEDSYRSLNTLIGLDAKERPVLQDAPQFSAYEIDDLELQVLRKIDIDPDIWKANKEVEKAKLSVDLYTYNSGDESYDVKELAVENTELSVSDAKKQARDNVISAYNNIFNLEQQY